MDAESKDNILKELSKLNLEWEKLNNENNANFLVYLCSAMDMYQNTLIDVEDFSISQYNNLIAEIEKWNVKLKDKLNKVIYEQSKLGKTKEAPTTKETLSNLGNKIMAGFADVSNLIE